MISEYLVSMSICAGCFVTGALYVWRHYATGVPGAVAIWLRLLMALTWPVTILAMIIDHRKDPQ